MERVSKTLSVASIHVSLPILDENDKVEAHRIPSHLFRFPSLAPSITTCIALSDIKSNVESSKF
jgi:hypothetical protein